MEYIPSNMDKKSMILFDILISNGSLQSMEWYNLILEFDMMDPKTFFTKKQKLIDDGFVEKKGKKYYPSISKSGGVKLSKLSSGFKKIDNKTEKILASSNPFEYMFTVITDYLYFYEKLNFLRISKKYFTTESEQYRLKNQISNIEKNIKNILDVLNHKDPNRAKRLIDSVDRFLDDSYLYS